MEGDSRDLLSIGRFAELTGLTVKALRLYDERGLLRPAVVDLASGYRYYSREQAPAAEQIRRLRSLDMPLEEIGALLATDDLAARQARLHSHRRRLEERIASQRQALSLLSELDRELEHRKERKLDAEKKDYKCSFCGKPHQDVHRLIAGPNRVYICDACVGLCNEILARETQGEEAHR